MQQFSTTEITTIDELLNECKSNRLSYDLELVQQAFTLATQIHSEDVRKSGAPLIYHLLTVAAYMVRLSLDTTSVIAALLHESLEKDRLKLDELDNKFGTEVAFIVDGLTSLKSQTGAFSSHNEAPDSFRHLILNSTEDIRILIIRLANKLHNLQSWQCLTPERRTNQAHKTLLVYAPLCEYLGLGNFLTLFQQKAFEVLHPKEYRLIEDTVSKISSSRLEQLEQLSIEVKEILTKAGIENIDLSFRTKNPYSIYKKAIRKYVPPGEELQEQHILSVRDLMGIRLILPAIEDCYIALGMLHTNFEYEQEEFDDYILKPKESGYRSIHTVLELQNFSIEVQIRTAEMHEYNEFGPASHIAYKLGNSGKKQDMTWTKDLVEWQNPGSDAQKFKVKAFSDSIFVFTPEGEIIRLHKGSTPIDFAFRVHTDIGYHYQGAKVNGIMRSMSQPLQTGDIIEVLTSKHETVNWNWLNIAQMNFTKSKIRKRLKDKQLINQRP